MAYYTRTHTHTHDDTMNGFVYEIRIMQSIEFSSLSLSLCIFPLFGLHVASCKTTTTTNRRHVRAIYYNAQIEIRKYISQSQVLPTFSRRRQLELTSDMAPQIIAVDSVDCHSSSDCMKIILIQ